MKMKREGNYYFRKYKHKKESVRKNTMLKNIRIRIGALLRILLFFWINIIQINITILSGVCKQTVCRHYGYVRKLFKKIRNNNPEVLGGQNRIVEVDETLLRKRKYNKGRVKPNNGLLWA